MIATVVIEANDPDRFVPPSWQLEVDFGESPAQMAERIAQAENVTVVRILNDRGLEVWSRR